MVIPLLANQDLMPMLVKELCLPMVDKLSASDMIQLDMPNMKIKVSFYQILTCL